MEKIGQHEHVMSSVIPMFDFEEQTSEPPFDEDTSTTISVFFIVVGCVLLVGGVFLVMVAEDSTIMKTVRLILVHHAFLLILMSLNAIIGHVFGFGDNMRPRCLVLWIIREMVENLVHWSLVLLALFGLALYQMQGSLHEFLNNTRLHIGLVIALWLVCGVVEIVIFTLLESFEDLHCDVLTCPSFIAKTVALVFSHVVLIVLVVMGYISARRSARMVSTEQEDFVARTRMKRQFHLAGTLAIVCRVAAVIDLVTSFLYLYHASTPSCKWPANAFLGVLFSVWYLGQACIFPIFLARHQIIRQHLKKVVCRKCFWLQNDTFERTMECRFSTVEDCRQFMSTPMGQMSLKRSRAANRRSDVGKNVQSKSEAAV